MCGIIGYYGNISEADKVSFDWGLFHTGLARGPDSTGVTTLSRETHEFKTYKSMGLNYNLEHDDLHEWNGPHRTVKGNLRALLGHGRKATVGKVNIENAHPFEFDKIIGAHNGTFEMNDLKKFKGFNEFNIDSQILMHEINECDVDIPDVYSRAYGAMACWVVDKEHKTLHLWRNSQRPLFVFWSKEKDKVVFASEPHLFYMAARRTRSENDWDLGEKPTPIAVDTLFNFRFDDETGQVVQETEKMKAATFLSSSTTKSQAPWSNWMGNQNRHGKGQETTTKTASSVIPKKSDRMRFCENFADFRPDNFFEKKGTITTKDAKHFHARSGFYVWHPTMGVYVWFDKERGLFFPYYHLGAEHTKSMFYEWGRGGENKGTNWPTFHFAPHSVQNDLSDPGHLIDESFKKAASSEDNNILGCSMDWILCDYDKNTDKFGFMRSEKSGVFRNWTFGLDYASLSKFVVLRLDEACGDFWLIRQPTEADTGNLIPLEELVTRDDFFNEKAGVGPPKSKTVH